MMKKSVSTLLPLVFACLALTSCHRTSREVWEDSKTAGRYVRRGVDSFFGRHIDDDMPISFDGERSEDLDYLPLLSDDDRYAVSGNIPPPRESPGEPGSPIPGIDGFMTPSGELAALFSNVHFETDKYTVTGKENVEALNVIADYLNQHPSVYVFVEGHADERGAAAYNLSLGSKRANSIRTFLVERGIDSDRLFTISFGKERPVVFGHDEGSWLKNRRGEFKIYTR